MAKMACIIARSSMANTA